MSNDSPPDPAGPAPGSRPRDAKRPMVEADRGVVLRDFAIFWVKLFVDGLKDVALLSIAGLVVILDMIAGGGKRPRLFYSLLRQSERFDLWLNLNGALEEMEREGGEEGLFGASRAGDDTLLGQLEKLWKGREE